MMNEKKYNICAIIAEYNPFHNGHKFHIENAKKDNDFVIVILSGDFTQRGEPAILNKYIRTKMALLNGADLVIELPTVYALSSAEGFANGAINIINSLNCINSLSFGSECGDINELRKLSKFLLNTDEEFNNKVKNLLKSGINYPSAISKIADSNIDSELLNNPNNILAIEYLKALLKTDSNVIPSTVLRNDNGYNNIKLSSTCFSSATSIRNALFDNISIEEYVPLNIIDDFNNRLMTTDDFSDVMYYSLISKLDNGYTAYLDITEELSDKIIKNLNFYTTLSEFEEKLKSKNLTRNRINRSLFHILLDIKKEDANITPSYARILGFKSESASLLSIIKKNSKIELISKLTQATNCSLLDKDIFAANIYEQISKSHINEYQQSPIKL